MPNKLLSVTVKGRHKTWSFNFIGDTDRLEEWRRDGLEVDVIENIIPEWVVDLGLTKAWVFCQDVINFKNPLGGITFGIKRRGTK